MYTRYFPSSITYVASARKQSLNTFAKCFASNSVSKGSDVGQQYGVQTEGQDNDPGMHQEEQPKESGTDGQTGQNPYDPDSRRVLNYPGSQRELHYPDPCQDLHCSNTGLLVHCPDLIPAP